MGGGARIGNVDTKPNRHAITNAHAHDDPDHAPYRDIDCDADCEPDGDAVSDRITQRGADFSTRGWCYHTCFDCLVDGRNYHWCLVGATSYNP